MNRPNVTRLTVLTSVVKQPFYAIIAIAIAVALGLIYHSLTLSLIPSSMKDLVGLQYIDTSFALTFIAAALAGVNISLLIFSIRGSRLIAIKGTGTSTAFGSVLMAFTPGCPMCTTLLTIALGTVGGIIALPLLGLEFKIVSVAALAFSMYWTLGKIQERMEAMNQARRCG